MKGVETRGDGRNNRMRGEKGRYSRRGEGAGKRGDDRRGVGEGVIEER